MKLKSKFNIQIAADGSSASGKTTGARLFSKKYGIISFDEGDYVIPKIKIQIGDKSFSTDSKKITVNLVQVDTTKQGLYEIKPIYDKFSAFEIFKLTLSNNYPVIIFIIFLILLI